MMIKAFLNSLVLRGAAQGTIDQRAGGLRRIQKDLGEDLLTLTSARLAEYLFSNQSWSNNYRRNTLATVRVFYKWAHREGYIPENIADQIVCGTFPKNPPLPPVDEKALHQAINDVQSVRDLAILLLAATIGLRRSEIAGLKISAKTVGLLRVLGKGNKVREVPLDPVTDSILDKLLLENGTDSDEYFFPGRYGGHAHPASIYKWAKQYIGSDWPLHSLRRRAATKAYEGTRDIVAVKEFLGHANINTTMFYVATDRQRISAAVEAASFINLHAVRKMAGMPEVKQPLVPGQADFLQMINEVTQEAARHGLEIRIRKS